eukprot:198118-Heterocapsa_arctica.AAC.1
MGRGSLTSKASGKKTAEGDVSPGRLSPVGPAWLAGTVAVPARKPGVRRPRGSRASSRRAGRWARPVRWPGSGRLQ